jgi:hypothetical protein
LKLVWCHAVPHDQIPLDVVVVGHCRPSLVRVAVRQLPMMHIAMFEAINSIEWERY